MVNWLWECQTAVFPSAARKATCSTAAPRRTGPVGTVFPSDLQYKRKGSARQLWDGMSNAFVCILRYIAPLHSLTMPLWPAGGAGHTLTSKLQPQVRSTEMPAASAANACRKVQNLRAARQLTGKQHVSAFQRQTIGCSEWRTENVLPCVMLDHVRRPKGDRSARRLQSGRSCTPTFCKIVRMYSTSYLRTSTPAGEADSRLDDWPWRGTEYSKRVLSERCDCYAIVSNF